MCLKNTNCVSNILENDHLKKITVKLGRKIIRDRPIIVLWFGLRPALVGKLNWPKLHA